MLYGIVGKKGQGKTLLLTWLLFRLQDQSGQKLLANYTLYGREYDYMNEIPENPDDFLGELENKICGFDELHMWLDSRTSMSKENILITNILSLSRHAKTHFFYTTQDMGKVDRRIRRETNYVSTVRSMVRVGGVPAYLHYQITDMNTFKTTSGIADVRNVLFAYDTHEILRMPRTGRGGFKRDNKNKTDRGRDEKADRGKQEKLELDSEVQEEEE